MRVYALLGRKWIPACVVLVLNLVTVSANVVSLTNSIDWCDADFFPQYLFIFGKPFTVTEPFSACIYHIPITFG